MTNERQTSQLARPAERSRAQDVNARLAAIVESTSDAIVSRGLDGTIQTWNPAAERLFGWTAQEAIGQSIAILVPPERRGEMRPLIERMIAGETIGAVESTHLRKDGTCIESSVTFSVIRDPEDKVAAISLIYRDVTERKALEAKALRKTELTQLLETLTRTVNEAASPEEAMQRCLRHVCEFGRWTLGSVGTFASKHGGTPQTSYWHAANREPYEAFISFSKREEYVVRRGQFVGKALGEKRPVWISDIAKVAGAERMEHAVRSGLRSAFAFPVIVGGEVAVLLEFFSEETREPDELLLEAIESVAAQLARLVERDSAGKAVKASEARLRAILDAEPECVKVVAADGTLLEINRAGLEMLEARNLAQAQAHGLINFVAPEYRERFAGKAREALGGKRVTFEFEITGLRGRRRWLESHATRMALPNRDDTAILAITRDVTERKAQEKRIEILSRVRAVSSETNAAIVRARTPQSLMEEACRIAVEQGKFGSAWIGLLDPQTLDITPVAWAGEGSEETRTIRSTARDDPPRGQGTVSRAVRERRAIVNNDLTAPGFVGPRLDAVLKLGFRSTIALPLYRGDAVAGTFTLYAKEPGFFDEDEIELLNGLAGNVSFALQSLAHREKAEYLSQYDALTGLPNRSLFRDRLELAVAHARRRDETLGVLLVNLDRFRKVNESLGHDAGDDLLRQVASRLKSSLREVDTIARLDGNDFAILVEGIQSSSDAVAVAEKLIQTLDAAFDVHGQEIFVSASIGVAVCSNDGCSPEPLVEHAGIAMSRAKREGAGGYHLYVNEPVAPRGEPLTLETRLRHALKNGELSVHYQPKVNLATGAITGAEALLRWDSPELGRVSPAQFIPVAEETGFIVPISEWVLGQACAQARAWRDAGFSLDIAVNLSPRQFRQRNLLGVVSNVLEATGLPPESLELEITETMTLAQPEQATSLVNSLRGLGVRIALDDFGTGYSSLSHLRCFPLNTLKIDRSFVQDATSNPGSAAIVHATIALAHSLKLKVVAEGVETEVQRDFLEHAGCDEMQGYLYSHPLPAAEFLALLEARNRGPA